jgi:hypothetical protein
LEEGLIGVSLSFRKGVGKVECWEVLEWMRLSFFCLMVLGLELTTSIMIIKCYLALIDKLIKGRSNIGRQGGEMDYESIFSKKEWLVFLAKGLTASLLDRMAGCDMVTAKTSNPWDGIGLTAQWVVEEPML